MSNSDSSQGLYSLSAREIYAEAKNVFQDFFVNQTPLNAFKLSIALYHLKEWIYESEGSNDAAKTFVNKLENCENFEILRSIANTSKHFQLTRKSSQSYEQIVSKGFILGKSVVDEKLSQDNLAIDFNSKEVWLREVFADVLKQYADYFEDPESIYPVKN